MMSVTGMKKSFFKIIACTSIHNKPQLKRAPGQTMPLKGREEGAVDGTRVTLWTNDDNCVPHISPSPPSSAWAIHLGHKHRH